MTALSSRLSKLETLAGVGMSRQEQFSRLVESQSDEILLKVLALIRAQIAGTEPPSVSDEVVSLVQRLCSLMPTAT